MDFVVVANREQHRYGETYMAEGLTRGPVVILELDTVLDLAPDAMSRVTGPAVL